VTDGLVLSLDAANARSYTSGSTTWSDLTFNLATGSLINGPVYNQNNGGSISFDGVDDYVYVPSLTWSPVSFTVFWFIYPNNTLSFNQGIGALNNWGYFNSHTTSTGQMYVGTDVTNRLNPVDLPANTMEIGKWQNFCFTANITASSVGPGSFYKNGMLLASKSVSQSAGAWTGFMIGANGSSTINGRIAAVQIYNRALSAQEVLQNYNATKTRFGL
jgi:hypothetical protein